MITSKLINGTEVEFETKILLKEKRIYFYVQTGRTCRNGIEENWVDAIREARELVKKAQKATAN